LVNGWRGSGGSHSVFFSRHVELVAWIEECITTPRFPYLFVLAMEVLSSLLEEAATVKKVIYFHPKCENLHLTHLCFVNDLPNFFLG
jgi:hypothetical protein